MSQASTRSEVEDNRIRVEQRMDPLIKIDRGVHPREAARRQFGEE
jgi:hypothetical protein